VTFEFARPIRLAAVERHPALLHAEYDFGDRGRWAFDIEPEKVSLQRI
jgi:hypothetical protein